jgi:hypothetical protein
VTKGVSELAMTKATAGRPPRDGEESDRSGAAAIDKWMETCVTNTWGRDRRRSRSSGPVVAHTIPLRTTKGKSVAYLAWKLTNLAGQEVGEVDPAAGFPDPMTTEETKAPEGGAGEARLPNSAATV